MPTIAYDLPVRDFIGALDATGHVTHTQHRKSKITFHHNGGRLSHEGVLSVWQVRPASAHFNFDAVGSCAQFVRINEYAWATGSTDGNQQSISFEMANLTLGPEWNVAEITWRRAARLAGWIHARVFGWRPTRESIVVHHYWSSTMCAGPYIDKVYDQILSVAQASYDAFASGGAPDEGDEVSWDKELTNAEGYTDKAGNLVAATEMKVDQLRRPVPVFGENRTTDLPTEISYLPHNFAVVNTKLDGLTAAVNYLAQKLAEGGGATAEELKAAVREAIEDGIVQVDVEVRQRHEAAVANIVSADETQA